MITEEHYLTKQYNQLIEYFSTNNIKAKVVAIVYLNTSYNKYTTTTSEIISFVEDKYLPELSTATTNEKLQDVVYEYYRKLSNLEHRSLQAFSILKVFRY